MRLSAAGLSPRFFLLSLLFAGLLLYTSGRGGAAEKEHAPAPAPAAGSESETYTLLDRLHTAKKYDEALLLCRKYLELKKGKTPDGRLGMLFGKVLLRSAEPKELAKASEAFRWAYVSDPRLEEEGLFRYAGSLRHRGFWGEAAYGFRRFLDTYPRSVYADDARVMYGETILKNGQPEEAIRVLGELVENPATEDRARVGLLKAFSFLGEFEEAGPELAALIEKAPDLLREDEETLLAAARTTAALDRPDEARFYLDTLNSDFPISPLKVEGDLLMGDILKGQKRLAEAENFYTMAAKNPKTAAAAGLGMMEILLLTDRPKEAQDLGEKILKENPFFTRRGEVSGRIGRAMEAQGMLAESLPKYREAGERAEVVRVLRALHERDTAAFLTAYQPYMDHMIDSNELGEILLIEGRLEDAKTVFKGRIMGTDQDRAIRNLAMTYMAMGFDSLALDFLGDMIKRGVREDTVFRLYAELCRRVGRDKDAVAALEKIIDKTGEDWYMIAVLAERMGLSTRALDGYGRAIGLGVNRAYLARAECLRRLGKGREAAPDYRIAMDVAETDDDRLWATYQAGLLTGDTELIKKAGQGAGIVAGVAKAVAADRDFKERHGGNRAVK